MKIYYSNVNKLKYCDINNIAPIFMIGMVDNIGNFSLLHYYLNTNELFQCFERHRKKIEETIIYIVALMQ